MQITTMPTQHILKYGVTRNIHHLTRIVNHIDKHFRLFALIENVVFEPDESNNSHFTAVSGLIIADSDGDNIPDNIEDTTCTDTYDADTDDDGIPDGVEDANQDGIVDPGATNPS